MSENKTDVDHIVIEGITYDEDAELEIQSDGGEAIVTNHDELVAEGKTKWEAIALSDTEDNRTIIADDQLVTPDDKEWRESYSELDVGDSIEIVA